MFERLPAFRRLPHRQRFRDRMLLGMLLVALAPLVVFTAVVAADLGSVSQSTVEDTHRAILQDQEDRQRQQVADRALAIDIRLGSIADEVAQLRDQTAAVLGRPPAGPLPRQFFQNDRGAYYVSTADPDTSVIVGQTSHLVHAGALDTQNHSAPIAAPSAPLVTFMEGMRKNYPEIEAVWIADKVDLVIRTVPSMDVPRAVLEHRLDPDTPLGPDGDTIFSTSQARFAAAANLPQAWSDPAKPGPPSTRPFWTDPYTTRIGDEGVTVWMPVGPDGRTLVGADLTVAQVTAGLVQPSISGEPGAYPLLLSSNDKVLAAGDQARADFHLGRIVGDSLPLTGGTGFGDGMQAVEQTGHPVQLRATLSQVDRAFFATPIYTAHWVLATSVPYTDLEPDVNGLTRGIQTGVHRILLHVIPIALILCALAFVAAHLVARRLVGPVRALQASAERLALGRTDVPVPPQGTDEVGMLAASLERMRREINASRDAILAAARELEGRVAERTHELRTRNEELVALNALAGALTRALDGESILAGAMETARAVLPAVAGRGYVVADAGGTLAEHARWVEGDNGSGAGLDDELLGVARTALAERGVAVIHGERPDPVLVGLPFQTSEGDLGALAVACRPGTHLAERTRTLLGAVSDQVGLALRTVQLAAEGRELAVLEERTRLAREIHDTLAQQLTAIVIQLEAAEAYVERSPGRANTLVITARDLARSALQEARRSVWNLRPTPLDATGLVAALEREVRRWREQTGVSARLRAGDLPNPLRLQPAAEVALFRIVQEALANAGRHSHARHVEVVLARHDGFLEVAVADDGDGFDAHSDQHPGSFGLMGMGERARLAGGRLEISSAPGRGTQVRVRLPLDEAAVPVAAPA